MEFGLVTICIGPCPLVFLARVISITATTITLMICTRKIIRKSIVQNNALWLRLFLALIVLVLAALASIIGAHILFSLILNVIAGGGICTGFVHATLLENCIPLLGTVVVLTRKANRRVLKFVHTASSLLFFGAISVALRESIVANLILYDAWGLDLEWPYHGDYDIYIKYAQRIDYFAIAVVTYFSLIFSYFVNRLLRSSKPRFPIVRGFLLVCGLLVTWVGSLILYTEIYTSLAYSGLGILFLCVLPGMFVRIIPLTIYAFTWLIMNVSKSDVYAFWKRAVKKRTNFSLEQIKIASPCPASWEEMLGDEKVRFCQMCSKNVYNLSSMTKDEAQTLVMDHQGKLCGLLYLRKDGSVMTADCPVGFREIRRRVIKKIAKVAGAAFAVIGLQQFFVGDRSEKSSPWDEELAPAIQKEHTEEKVEMTTMGALGYIDG